MSQRPGISTLWLPLTRPRVAWSAALVVAIAYLFGMARGIGFYDSGELAVAAAELGLGHPPGQPLYTLLGFLVSNIPGVSPLLALNALSALCGALTVLPVLSLAERMLPAEADRPGTRLDAPLVSTAVVTVFVSQHAALWEQSTRIEVYAFAALLAVWCCARLAFVLERGSSSESFLGVGAVLGCCAAVNPVFALFAALSGLPALLSALRARELSWFHFGLLVGGTAIGLVPYMYVPLIGDRVDRFVWGAPARSSALIDFLTVRDFRANLGVPFGRWLEQTFAWLGFASDSGLLPVWIVGLSGHVVAPPGKLTRFAAPLAALLATLYLGSYALFRPDVPDCVSYASIATWLCAAGCAGLVGNLWARSSRLGAVGLALAVSLATALAPPFLFTRTRRAGDPARELSERLLASLPPRSLLVVRSDHWVSPLWYLQEVEGARPDIVIIAVGLLGSPWYFEHLYRRHPELPRIALTGPGEDYGRLSRLLASQPDRPAVFEVESDAEAIGLPTCLGPVFAHARVACSALPAHYTAFTDQLAKLTERTDAGEPTVSAVVSSMALSRARMLANHGHMPETLRCLFAGVDPVMAKLDGRLLDHLQSLPRTPLDVPRWQRPVALGEPARNLYLAAQLARHAGDYEHALVWLMLARDLGLPEAERDLERLAQNKPRTP